MGKNVYIYMERAFTVSKAHQPTTKRIRIINPSYLTTVSFLSRCGISFAPIILTPNPTRSQFNSRTTHAMHSPCLLARLQCD